MITIHRGGQPYWPGSLLVIWRSVLARAFRGHNISRGYIWCGESWGAGAWNRWANNFFLSLSWPYVKQNIHMHMFAYWGISIWYCINDTKLYILCVTDFALHASFTVGSCILRYVKLKCLMANKRQGQLQETMLQLGSNWFAQLS